MIPERYFTVSNEVWVELTSGHREFLRRYSAAAKAQSVAENLNNQVLKLQEVINCAPTN